MRKDDKYFTSVYFQSEKEFTPLGLLRESRHNTLADILIVQ